LNTDITQESVVAYSIIQTNFDAEGLRALQTIRKNRTSKRQNVKLIKKTIEIKAATVRIKDDQLIIRKRGALCSSSFIFAYFRIEHAKVC
jgi:hypothetical protein